jgi:hypothetical protein
VLEMYGSGYHLDTDKQGYKVRNKQTHAADSIQLLTTAYDCLSSITLQLTDKPVATLFSGSNTFKSCLLNLIKFMMDCFSDLIQIQEEEQQRWLREKQKKEKEGAAFEEDNNDFECLPQGHLVIVGCGHRGKPNRQEEKRISRLLRKSGFIPMLEAIQ